jgi:hypothetical protein
MSWLWIIKTTLIYFTILLVNLCINDITHFLKNHNLTKILKSITMQLVQIPINL